MFSRYLSALVAASAVLALGLSATSSAVATEVTPANSLMTAKLEGGTSATFTPANGTSGLVVVCKASSTEFKTPSNLRPLTGPPLNNNNPHTAAIPQAGGSVLSSIANPTFTECSSVAGVTTSVATNSTAGKWSLDWNVLNAAGAGNEWTTAAIGVPKSGAVITLTVAGQSCLLTVDPENAQGIIGYWHNGKNEVVAPKGKEASALLINEQVFYGANATCEAEPFNIKTEDSPAVFRATYLIENAAKEGVVEKYS
jgi:hypothetical protein